MPSFAQLSDQEIADILTYVRTFPLNNQKPFAPEMVAEMRRGMDPALFGTRLTAPELESLRKSDAAGDTWWARLKRRLTG